MKKHIATLCGDEKCKWCPEVFHDAEAEETKRVSITDDFAKTIQMSEGQFRAFVKKAKDGDFDGV